MDFQAFIAPSARQDLRDITGHTAEHDSRAALRLGEELLAVAESLRRFPQRGRSVPEFDRPEWREIVCRSFRIIYRVIRNKQQIEVSRFWHAARGFPHIPIQAEEHGPASAQPD